MMELLEFGVVAAVLVALGAGWLHSALGKKIDAALDTKLVAEEALHPDLKAAVDAIQATASAIHQKATTEFAAIHAKIDAVRTTLGGALTAAEHSQLVTDVQAKIADLEALASSTATFIESSKALLNTVPGTVVVTAVPAASAAPAAAPAAPVAAVKTT